MSGLKTTVFIGRTLLVVFSIVFTISLGISYVYADTNTSLPESELQALTEYPSWVASTSSCSPDLNGPVGSGPLFGLEFPAVANAQDLVNNINKYISETEPSSPFVDLGSDFVAAGQQYNVNPAMMVGFAYKEESLATSGQPVVTVNHNSFGISGNNPGQQNQYPVVDGWTSYPSFKASIYDAADYISAGYIKSGALFYSTTLAQLMSHYTPNTAGQSSEQQVEETLDVEHKILDGIATTGGATAQTDSASDIVGQITGCDGSTTTYISGQDGYSLTGTNAMAHYYQCNNLDGSPAPWMNVEYGNAGTVCAGGCGITSMTMVVDTLAGASENPGQMAQKYGADYGTSQGTSWGLWPAAAKDYGLTYTDLGEDFDAVANIIHQGGLVIVSVGAGYFTGGSHLMVIRAVDSQGNFYLADPNGPRPANNPTETRGFSESFMLGQGNANQLFAFTKGGSS